ncbi:MAG: type IV pilus twitching motility protein PilT [Clostridia bacterium]|nr:type IV pilus twitching motility protein PilT [Clostridia bacterium]
MEYINQPSSYPVSLEHLLRLTVEKKGSDLHIVVGMPPCIRIDGDIVKQDFPPMSPADVENTLMQVLSERNKKDLRENLELDISYSVPQCARFRGNVIVQRGTLAAVFRAIPFEVPTLDRLGLPADVRRLCSLPRGLILVTGPTGSGKSTTLAAMINHMNMNYEYNIVTVEDPIEFLHSHKRSIIRQRELGGDTLSFNNALRTVLRHDPDVIMIGEMRDPESISIALTAAETGHLVLSTLHTQTAPLTIARIIDSFPSEQQNQIRSQLSNTLRAVISQQLMPRIGGGCVSAVEYMVDTPAIRNMIREGKDHQIYSTMQTAQKEGMQTMDQALLKLLREQKITREEVLENCVERAEILRQIQMY